MEIETGRQRKPNTGSLLGIATKPVYPWFIIKLEKTRKGQNPRATVRIRAEPEIVNYIKKAYGTDELLVYMDPTNGKIDVWTPSMHQTFEAMEQMELMNSKEEWVINARPLLEKILSKMSSQWK